jgi:hypothetical protein
LKGISEGDQSSDVVYRWIDNPAMLDRSSLPPYSVIRVLFFGNQLFDLSARQLSRTLFVRCGVSRMPL